MHYTIWCNPMHPLYDALPVPYVAVPVTRAACNPHRISVHALHDTDRISVTLVTLMLLLAAEPRSTAGPIFPSQCPCRTILLTMCSMLWDWRVLRAWTMRFYCPKLLNPFLCFF